jgi:hypothetical protein
VWESDIWPFRGLCEKGGRWSVCICVSEGERERRGCVVVLCWHASVCDCARRGGRQKDIREGAWRRRRRGEH